MTIGEVSRAIESKNRMLKIEAQEKAAYDYALASLIVKGIGITLGSKEQFPTAKEAYPTIFEDADKKQQDELQQKRDELSALRFRQFAQSYNKKWEVPKENNE